MHRGWRVLRPDFLSNCRSPYGPIDLNRHPTCFRRKSRQETSPYYETGSINNTGRRPSSSAEWEIGVSAIMHWSESPRPPAVPGKGLTLIAKLIVTNVRSPTGEPPTSIRSHSYSIDGFRRSRRGRRSNVKICSAETRGSASYLIRPFNRTRALQERWEPVHPLAAS